MTKKITPKMLRESAEKYKVNARYLMSDMFNDLGINKRKPYNIAVVLDAIAGSIEEHYIELPTDEDGNVLYVGSTVYDKDGALYYVHGVSTGKRNVFLFKFSGGKDCARLYRSSNFTITKPDSWEEIIYDAVASGLNLISYDDGKIGEADSPSAEELIARCRKLAACKSCGVKVVNGDE